jgi:hypothetical protein
VRFFVPPNSQTPPVESVTVSYGFRKNESTYREGLGATLLINDDFDVSKPHLFLKRSVLTISFPYGNKEPMIQLSPSWIMKTMQLVANADVQGNQKNIV